MSLDALRESVCEANCNLVRHSLVTLTWGNVSGYDSVTQQVVIKPSGVPYDELRPERMVVVDLSGDTVKGNLRPSSDTPTHVRLYRAFANTAFRQGGGITHTHSLFATQFAQARSAIPCYGTTHADHFHGPVPVTRPLTEAEVAEAYEAHTANVIVELFERQQLDPVAMPAVLVAGHAPFTWGASPAKSVDNAIALEAVARMVLGTRQINPDAPTLEPYVLEKHYQRKHGPAAYYGQR